MKIPKLSLEKCIENCRTAELSKEQSKEIEDNERIYAFNAGQGGKQNRSRKVRDEYNSKQLSNPVGVERKCKYCGGMHEWNKTKCPAYGKECRKCRKLNHFASVCKTKRQTVRKIDTSSDYEEIKMVKSSSKRKPKKSSSTKQFPKRLYASITVGKQSVKFQLDSGATCSVISLSTLERCLGKVQLTGVSRVLKMYNHATVQPVGQCVLQLKNEKTGNSYETEFVVLKQECMPLLGSETIQQMNLITVRYENILLLSVKSSKTALTKDSLIEQYSDVFQGTGKFDEQYHITIDPDATPVVHPPRSVPIVLKDDLKAELDRLESEGILIGVTEPTPWVLSMVVVRKPTGKLRICIDPKDLNKVTRRSHYPIPTIDEILPDLREAKVFSVFDVRNGFWHVELDEESSLLTTFITPFGRYRWLRFPFGLTSAPEEFQRRQHRVIENLPGVVAIHNDILVIGNGATHEEAQRDHDVKVHALMCRCREKNTTLNADKVKLCCNEVTFMGHLLTDEGLKPDPDKVRAILEMPEPTDVTTVRRLIGFVNYLQRFLPNLSEVCEPLRNLTHKDTSWRWTEEQQLAFDTMKQLVGEITILKYYQPCEELTLQCDASEKGLGAVISQNGQLLAFASRALSRAEVNYAQIEKELLAVLFGLEKFRQYTYGHPVRVQSDHKPLESIMKKPLHMAPRRLQRMLLRLQGYDIDVVYRRGKNMELSDMLSRAYLQESGTLVEIEVESINVMHSLPFDSARLEDIRAIMEIDESMQELKKVILKGWPDKKSDVSGQVRQYFGVRDELTVQDGPIFRGERMLVPKELRKHMIQQIHSTHIGVEGCPRRARESVYWPGMTRDIKDHLTISNPKKH